ncbi:MAG TPA: hypothetical protein VEA99_06065 [Gemmatimonadaceae bacterium]|nr:hypothetical protein [Gemmatimonadaceae bacterium]
MRCASDELADAIVRVLARVEQDPLAADGGRPGELLHFLMDVPGSFWHRHPSLYERYRAALRAGAMQRRALPQAERFDFWIRGASKNC